MPSPGIQLHVVAAHLPALLPTTYLYKTQTRYAIFCTLHAIQVCYTPCSTRHIPYAICHIPPYTPIYPSTRPSHLRGHRIGFWAPDPTYLPPREGRLGSGPVWCGVDVNLRVSGYLYLDYSTWNLGRCVPR